MTEIVFSFDTEDFVEADAAEGILRTARILESHHIRGCFNVVAELAKALERWGRQDVIEALKYHEIETHSLAHSYHPTINEYTDIEDYEAAREIFLRNESEALFVLRRIFGVDTIIAACPPGDSVSYVAHYGYAELGQIVYDGDYTIDAVQNRPVSYCNVQCLKYNTALEQLLINVDGSRQVITEDALRALLNSIAEKNAVYIFYHHPNRSMCDRHWDELNFYGENTPPEQWRMTGRLPRELTEEYYRVFDLLIRLIKEDPRFRIVTYSTIARENSETRTVKRCHLKGLQEQLEEDFFPVTLPHSFCLADLFHACRTFLCGAGEYTCGPVYGFLEEPYAITEPVTVTAEEMRRNAGQLSGEGFLPESIRVGEKTLGPADWLRAALRVLNGEDSVLLTPGPWQIDLDQFPHLRDLNLRKSWVNVKDMEDRHVSRRNRLQTWTIRLPEGSYRKIL